MSESYDLAPADHVTVGTVGEVGQRVFLLQAACGVDEVTLKVEKQQVAALSEYLGDLLDKLGRPAAPAAIGDLRPPSEPEWVVGSLGLAYDEDDDVVVLVAEELVEEGEEGAVARITMTREQAASLATRGAALVEAGRPACPLCGFPVDPSGHACPRSNGHRPPTT
ncbi:MAG TPA: DUF3090 family protein [Acidimicrobiales bacterium]|nr:DUF3090 family protein [Acidimicrobiales bacterium]